MWLKVKKLLLKMLRRINVETDKDPINDMLRRKMLLKVKKLLLKMIRRINVETDKGPIHDMLKRINVVESVETAS